MKVCDNQSVGVIIEQEGSLALLQRARFPIGMAPPAGHIDQHGSPEQAAIEEVHEELGLEIARADLIPTAITGRRVNNKCGRPGGDYHRWWVFRTANFSGLMVPDPDETLGADLYSPDQLQGLADRTRAYQMGRLATEAWEAQPGLEPVWLGFLEELDYVR